MSVTVTKLPEEKRTPGPAQTDGPTAIIPSCVDFRGKLVVGSIGCLRNDDERMWDPFVVTDIEYIGLGRSMWVSIVMPRMRHMGELIEFGVDRTTEYAPENSAAIPACTCRADSTFETGCHCGTWKTIRSAYDNTFVVMDQRTTKYSVARLRINISDEIADEYEICNGLYVHFPSKLDGIMQRPMAVCTKNDGYESENSEHDKGDESKETSESFDV